MMPWLNRLITRGSPFGFTACMGSKSPPAVMICCTFTASIAAHPPMAAADSSINARAASGPDGAGEEQADKSIRRTKAITNINPSLNSKRARTVSSSYRNALYPGLVKPTIHLCAFSLCLVSLCLRRDRGSMQRSAQALEEPDYRCRLRRHNRFHGEFAIRVQYRDYCRCLVQVEPNILVTLH